MSNSQQLKFDWVDAVKGMAIIGIMLVHLVELFPKPASFPYDVLYFLGKQGDMAPGVFFLLSGFGLALSYLKKEKDHVDPKEFYQKRLSRLFPLYISIFLFFLVLRQFGGFGDSQTMITDGNTFFKLWGLGFTRELFTYINPSWWFIWTLLQFYLLFPFVYRFFAKHSTPTFLAIFVGISLLFRYLPVLGYIPVEQANIWERGIFVGTRIGEFAIGMSLAKFLFANRNTGISYGMLFPIGIGVYALGLWISSIPFLRPFYSILYTCGMTAFMYGIWKIIRSTDLTRKIIGRPLIWMGVHSYSIFLFHQVPVMAAEKFFGDDPFMMALVGLGILAITVPISFVIEIIVDFFMKLLNNLRQSSLATWILLGLSLVTLGAVFILPFAKMNGMAQQAMYLGVLLLSLLNLVIWINSRERAFVLNWLILAGVVSGFMYVFGVPVNQKIFAIGFGIVVSGFVLLSYNLIQKSQRGWLFPASILGLIFGANWLCQTYAPLQAGEAWSELPAMMTNDSLRFSLIPNKETHLKYEAFDYVIKTNSVGLNSPEITEERPNPNTLRVLVLGDAIAMPEGFDYEEAFPHMLQMKIQDYFGSIRDVQVINAAVTGYAPAEQALLLPMYMEMYKPDVILYEFFNEYTQNIDYEKGKNPKVIKKLQKDVGFFPDGDGPTLYDHIMRSQLSIFVRKKGGTFLKETVMGKIKPHRYNRIMLKYFTKGDVDIYKPELIANMQRHLTDMKEAAEKGGAELYLVYVPAPVRILPHDKITYFPRDIDLSDSEKYDMNRPNKETKAMCDAIGMKVLDVTEDIASYEPQPTYFYSAWHLNENGHSAMTQILFDHLKKEGFLQLEPNKIEEEEGVISMNEE
ncbi:MAG: acyltransferase family protein [Bacteroidota bacterium]